MASFPSTLPPVPSEIDSYVRWWLANLPTTTMSMADMLVIIEMNIAKYPDDLCKITYHTTVDVLRWLIRSTAKGSADTAGSGAVKSRKEVAGRKEITISYDVGNTSGAVAGWDKVLEDLLANPTTIGCNPLPEASDTTGLVLIGGVNMDSYIANLDDPTTRNGFDINVSQVIDRRPTARERRRACVKFY